MKYLESDVIYKKNLLGVDLVGVDFVGVDLMGMNLLPHYFLGC